MKTIAIGADDAAIELKNVIKKLLEEKEYVVTDYTNDAQNDRPMYPDVAFALATAIQKNEFERGILLCGTGRTDQPQSRFRQRIRPGRQINRINNHGLAT